MNILKIKDSEGNWTRIPALKGAPTDEQVQDAVDEYLSDQPATHGFFTNSAKHTLLNLLEKVAYTVTDGAEYLSALQTELFNIPVDSISATFSQGQNVVYDTDTLDSLKQYLTVTVTYVDSTTETVQGYTLSGTLTPGTSTITVAFAGKTTAFNVTVTHGFLYEASDGLLSEQPYLTRVAGDLSAYTETASANGTRLQCEKSTTSTYWFYWFNTYYTNTCHMEVQFKINDISWNGAANTSDPGFLRFAAYDESENGVYVGFSRYGTSTADVKIRTKVGDTVTAGDVVSTGEWHTVVIDIANDTQTVKLDGVTVISGQSLSTPQPSGANTRIYLGRGTTNDHDIYIRKIEVSTT